MSQQAQATSTITNALGGRARIIPLCMLFAAAASYGLMPSINKIAMTYGVPPIAYTFWACVGGGAILLVACVVTGTLPTLGRDQIRMYLITGTLGVSFPTALLNFAAPHLPAGAIALLLALAPPLTYLIAFLIKLERFQWLSTLGLLCGFGGVIVLAVPEGALPEADAAAWLFLAMIAPVCFASVTIFIACSRPSETSSSALAAGMLLAGAVVLTPVMLVTEKHDFTNGLSLDDWAIFVATIVMAVFHYLFFETIRRAGAVFFAQIDYLIVLAGLTWAAILLGEHPTLWIWVALFLMLAGVYFVNAGTSSGADSSVEGSGT